MKSHAWMSRNSLSTTGDGKAGKNKKNKIYSNNMNKKNLGKYTTEELIEMLLATQKPTQKPKQNKNIIKQEESEFGLDYLDDDNPFPGFLVEKEDPMEKTFRQFRKKDISLLRKNRRVDRKYRELMNPELIQPKIRKLDKGLKEYKRSYEIQVVAKRNPLIQINRTRNGIFERLLKTLQSMKGFKLMETMKVTFEKTVNKTTITQTNYFNSVNHIVLNEFDLRDALKISNEIIMNKIGVWISEGSGWTVLSVDKHYVNVANYKPIDGSSYIDLPQELKSRKATINIKNEDNECFRWCHFRHLNPKKDHAERISQNDRKYVEKLDYSGISFSS